VILLTDPVGTITFVNPAFTELYGYEAREVVGLTTPRILKGGTMSPADYETLWKAITVKETVRREFVNKTKDGRLIQVEASLNPILDDSGAIAGFLTIQRDVTARKQTEFALRDSDQRYRAVVENIDEIVYVVETTGDPFAGRVVFVSDRVERTTGHTSQEFLENPQLWSSLIHPDDLSSVASLTRRMFRERTAVTRRYRIRYEPTDSYRWVDDRVVPQIGPARASRHLRPPRRAGAAGVVPVDPRSAGVRSAASCLPPWLLVGNRRRWTAAVVPGARRRPLARGAPQLRPGHRG
jgi:PAS domain S-box-containing protein